jgi:hypothetical protein
MGAAYFFEMSKRHPLQRCIKPKADSLFTMNCRERIKSVGGGGVIILKEGACSLEGDDRSWDFVI